MKLSEALDRCRLKLVLTEVGWVAQPVGPVDPDVWATIEQWRKHLATWWRQSPTAILECDQCAEIAIAGGSRQRRCWRCGHGTMAPLRPEFVRPRPRRRKRPL